MGRICLFLIAARDHRFGVRGGEQSDVQWRDQSGRELLRRQAYGRRGRGAGGKIPVFGLLKRGGKVYTKIIPNASSATLMSVIEHKIVPDSIVYSDS